MPKKINKGTIKLKKITSLAKKIRTKKPNMKWTDAIKQASKKLK